MTAATVLRFPARVKPPCIDPDKRGLVPHYETGMACPGCTWRAWNVGRMLAECANPRCSVALPLERI